LLLFPGLLKKLAKRPESADYNVVRPRERKYPVKITRCQTICRIQSIVRVLVQSQGGIFALPSWCGGMLAGKQQL
jgi:hypothetical protein